MPLLADTLFNRTPQDSFGRPYIWRRAVKTFETNSIATLEADVNAWITAFAAANEYAAVLGIEFIGQGTGNNSRVLVAYGWFMAP